MNGNGGVAFLGWAVACILLFTTSAVAARGGRKDRALFLAAFAGVLTVVGMAVMLSGGPS